MAVAGLASTAMAGPGDPIVGDPFILGYNGWQDVSPPRVGGGSPNWGIHLRTGALQESSDGHGGTGAAASGTTPADGKYTPYLMVNDFITPSSYTFSSTMASYDDDGFGVVFGFQDNQNYFRVGLRLQSNGNLGFDNGVSVQKVTGGVIEQIGLPNDSYSPPISRTTASTTPFQVDVVVNDTAWAVHINGDTTPILSGTDAALAPGKVGVHSWFQRTGATGTPLNGFWGTELRSATVSNGSGTLFHDSFGTASLKDASPVAWRPLQMTNSAGVTAPAGDDLGNFRLDFRNRTIADDTNGFEWATSSTPNVDFIGPGIVVDEPGSGSYGDYDVKVRMSNLDNDGIGVLVRVQDDNNFYRVNFAAEAMGTNGERAPRGMSIQKVKDGVWTEIFRDDQSNPLFVFTDGAVGNEAPFDVRVRMIGNSIRVQVVDDPDGNATIINYPTVWDTNDPFMEGTAGLHNWGSGAQDSGVIFSAYGGIAGMPFISEVPEPTMCVLMAAGGLALLRRRRAAKA